MPRSTGDGTITQVLTTGIGSLPRPEPMLRLLAARESGEHVDDVEFAETERTAVFEVVERQVRMGIDLPTNGEMGRPGFFHYVKDRFTGFTGPDGDWIARDLAEHPDLGMQLWQAITVPMHHHACTSRITVSKPEAVHQDIDLFRAALKAAGHEGDAVLTAPAPGVVVMNVDDLHYGSEELFLAGLAGALRHEYQAVVDAGFILQIDAPDLFLARNVAVRGSTYAAPRYRTQGEYHAYVSRSVNTLIEALDGLPSDRLRLHACNGNHPGSHEFDVHAQEILDDLLRLPVGSICLENGNPQHSLDHEPLLDRLADGTWPDGKTVIPGVVDTKSPVLETVEVVTRRIDQWRTRVPWSPLITSTDCGLSTYAGYPHLAASVAWRKLERLAEAARQLSGTVVAPV